MCVYIMSISVTCVSDVIVDHVHVYRIIQGTYQCPAELLQAATMFIYALWKGRRQTAITVLRQMLVLSLLLTHLRSIVQIVSLCKYSHSTSQRIYLYAFLLSLTMFLT